MNAVQRRYVATGFSAGPWLVPFPRRACRYWQFLLIVRPGQQRRNGMPMVRLVIAHPVLVLLWYSLRVALLVYGTAAWLAWCYIVLACWSASAMVIYAVQAARRYQEVRKGMYA